MSIFKKLLTAFGFVFMTAGVVQAGEIKFGVTDITGLESLQTEYGDFVNALEEITGDKVKFFPVNSRTAAVEALANSHVDYILTGPAEYIVFRARAKAVPVVAWQRLDYFTQIVTLNGNGIQTIADLKGKKVGFSVGGFEDAILAAMLARHNLTLDDVTLVNVNFSLSPALLSGQVDAVIGAFRNFELNQLAIEGHKGRAFYVEEEGVPPYDELILVANTAKLGDPRLAKVLRAIERGVQYLINHPDDAWTLFAGHKPGLDDELNRRAWRDTLPRFALRPAALDRGRYRRFANFLIAQGLMKTAPPVASYAVELE